jgi:hypothetical protein
MGRLKRRGSRGRLIPGGLRCEGQFGVHREEGVCGVERWDERLCKYLEICLSCRYSSI